MNTEISRFGFELLDPWYALTNDGSGLVAELNRELSKHSEIYGLKAKAIARRDDCDDVLFEIEGRQEKLAVVHLTWSGKTE